MMKQRSPGSVNHVLQCKNTVKYFFCNTQVWPHAHTSSDSLPISPLSLSRFLSRFLSFSLTHTLYFSLLYTKFLSFAPCWCQLPEASTLGWHNESLMASDFMSELSLIFLFNISILSALICMHAFLLRWWQLPEAPTLWWCDESLMVSYVILYINVWVLLPLIPAWCLHFVHFSLTGSFVDVFLLTAE